MFDRSRKVLDVRMKKLTMQWVGSWHCHKEFWATDSRASDSPFGQRCFLHPQRWRTYKCCFWYNCKCFGLRGGDEHRTLHVVLKQYSIGLDSVGRFVWKVVQERTRWSKAEEHANKEPQSLLKARAWRVLRRRSVSTCTWLLFHSLVRSTDNLSKVTLFVSLCKWWGKTHWGQSWSISAKKQDLWASTPTTVGRLPVPQPI